MTTKMCSGKNGCNQVKALTNFYCYRGKYKNNCKSCVSEYQQRINEKRRVEGFDAKTYHREYGRIRRTRRLAKLERLKKIRKFFNIWRKKTNDSSKKTT